MLHSIPAQNAPKSLIPPEPTKYSKLQIIEAAKTVVDEFTEALPFAAPEFADTIEFFLIDMFNVLEGGR